jgi:hypothetical protein
VIAGMALALAMLAGCGGAATSTSNGPAAVSGQPKNSGPQYLIKTLSVSMVFSNTRKTATDLQTWITTTDPRATSAGIDYQQVKTSSYRITMTYSVTSTAYPQVLAYLAGYARSHNGHLESLHEMVQDVSND